MITLKYAFEINWPSLLRQKKKEYYCKSCGEGQELLELKKSNNVLSLHEQRKRNQWIQDSTTNSETLKKRLYYCSLDPTTNS